MRIQRSDTNKEKEYEKKKKRFSDRDGSRSKYARPQIAHCQGGELQLEFISSTFQ
jgi:hypothetical protein